MIVERTPNLENIDYDRNPFPLEVVVETCSFCNLACIVCPYPKMKRPKGQMEFSVFKKIVDEIAEVSPKTRLWVAILGEPLLRGDSLVEMLKYAGDAGVSVHLNTNATYLTMEMAEKLLECKIAEVLISMDASTKETYDKIRIGGDFELVVKNVHNFLEAKQNRGLHKPDVTMQFIVMDENEHEVEQFIEYWLRYDTRVKVRLKMGWGDAIDTVDLKKTNIKRDRPCPWLLRAIAIHWDGRFSQCDADYEALNSPGNIRKQTIKEVWEGEHAKRRERHWALDFNFPPCETCKDWSVGRSKWYYPNGAK